MHSLTQIKDGDTLRMIGEAMGPDAVLLAGVNRYEGDTPETMVVLDRIKLVNPNIEELEKGADGLVRLKEGGVALADAEVRVQAGFIENRQ